MSVLLGPFVVAACLLAVAGFAKAAQPASTAGALAALHLPHRRWMVRAGGLLEAALACAAILTGNAVLAALVAVSYLAFAGFVIAARRAGAPLASCGCFGKIDTPPHPLHVVLDVLAACAAIGVAIHGGASISAVMSDQPWNGLPFALLVAIGVAAAALAMSALPQTLAAARGGRG
jgi:hypothetical protein